MPIIFVKLLRLAKILVFNVVLAALLFFLCEGLASALLFVQAIAKTPPLAERLHTEYDETLGWVSRPKIDIEDMYGPGRHLHTNAQGFRNDEDFGRQAPANKVRLICSGDSFTLGYGVGNEETWCQLLAAMDQRLQTVNMGQGGYGVDQAYLWYKRDGAPLDHDILLFTFITMDFERMRQTEFLGYGKPLLKIEGDRLVVDNVPVPRRSFYLPWLTQNRDALLGLTSVRLLSQFFESSKKSQESGTTAENDAPEKVAAAILNDLLRINAAKQSILVLIYLPTLGDYQPGGRASTDVWREFVNLAAQDTGVIFIDVVEEFRKLPPDQAQALFIPDGALDFPSAAGHYSVMGNQYVAQLLYEKLMALPEMSNKLTEIRP